MRGPWACPRVSSPSGGCGHCHGEALHSRSKLVPKMGHFDPRVRRLLAQRSDEEHHHRIRGAAIALEPTHLAEKPSQRVDFDPHFSPLTHSFCRAPRGRCTPRNSWPRCVRPVSHTATTTSSAPAASTRPRRPMPRARAPRSALILEIWPQLVCSHLPLAHTGLLWPVRPGLRAWHARTHGIHAGMA